MKNGLLLFIFCFTAQLALFSQHNTDLFGVPNKNDRGAKIIHTADNFYIVAGQSNNDAALYKYNCNGVAVDSIIYDFPVDGTYEVFADVVELPNGELLAVGDAFSVDGVLRHTFVLHASVDLEVIASDTIRIFGQLSTATQVEISPNGKVIMAGVVPGYFLDFSDIYCAELNPNTLEVTDSITKFTYGVDQVTGLSLMPNGNLILSGFSVIGNIFDANAQLQNTAWTRVINNAGEKIWDHTRTATFKSAYGRMQDRKAVPNPETGNIMVGGNVFSGDTLNPMDAYFMLFSATGNLLNSYTYQTNGSQNLQDLLLVSDPVPVFLAVGDSAGVNINEENAAFLFTVTMEESNGQITSVHPNSLSVPIRINSVVAVPAIRFAFAGAQFTTPYAPNNQEGFVAIPKIGVDLTQNGNQLFVSNNPPGNYTYSWYNNSQQIASTSNPAYYAVNTGTYTVQVVDNQGCKGESTNPVVITGQPPTVELFQLETDTICTNYPLSSLINPVGAAATYWWNYSDGTTSGQIDPDKSFAAPGVYTVSLDVTTNPGQFLITEVTIVDRESYFSITDPIPDLYILVKNNAGQEIYRSGIHYDISYAALPYTIPTAFFVKNEFYIIEIWDYDAFDSDDFLGEVYLTNPTIPGTYTTGIPSITINPEPAQATYTYSRTIRVIAPFIVNNNGVLEAKIDKSGTFTYTWYQNNVQVASGLGSTYTPPVNEGCYTVRISGGNICNELSAPYCFTVGAGEIAVDLLSGIIVAPQPLSAENDLTILMGENNTVLSGIALYNSLGQLIYSEQGEFGEKRMVLPTSELHLTAGVYVIRFVDSNGNTGAKNIAVIR